MVEVAMSDPACELEKLRAELAATKAELAQARAVVSTSEAMISGLKLEIALLRRETYGHSAERTARLIDQLELQLEDLVVDAAEDAILAEKTTKVGAFERKKPIRKPFPEHLPRERVVVGKHPPRGVLRGFLLMGYRVSLWTHTKTPPAFRFCRFRIPVAAVAGRMTRRFGLLRKANATV